MKIRNIRTYQAVQVGTKSETFFSAEATPNKSIYELEIVDHVGVKVSNSTDSAIIPFPNVSAIRLLTDHNIAEKEAKALEALKYEESKTPGKILKVKHDPTLRK